MNDVILFLTSPRTPERESLSLINLRQLAKLGKDKKVAQLKETDDMREVAAMMAVGQKLDLFFLNLSSKKWRIYNKNYINKNLQNSIDSLNDRLRKITNDFEELTSDFKGKEILHK